MTDEDALSLVAYCGLYCGLCAERARVPSMAGRLQETLKEEGYDSFYQFVPDIKDGYPQFMQLLDRFAKMECGCRSGKGGPPDCAMRECAKRRKLEACPMCDEYPCAKIESFAGTYPTLIQDGRRMKKVGIKKWVEEQEIRAKRGFVYSDSKYES